MWGFDNIGPKGFSLDQSTRLIMKIITLIALIALLLTTNCVALSFTPTMDDMAWMTEVVKDTKIIPADLDLITLMSGNSDLPGTKKYCDLAAIDIQTALENSQKYTVSNELQDTKYYWETALENMAIGAETASRGCAISDAGLITQGATLMSTGTENMMLANRALKVATA